MPKNRLMIRTAIQLIAFIALDLPTLATPSTCSGGAQQVFTVGQAGSLTASSTGGGGTISYAWSQDTYTEPGISSQASLAFGSPSSATTTISGYVFGPVNVKVRCTDSVGGGFLDSSVHHGAVQTGSNGVVVVANPTMNLLLGPQTQMNRSCDLTSCTSANGTNPWPWADQLQFAYAKRFWAAEDAVGPAPNAASVSFVKNWETFETGTITVSNGSTSVAGSGTNFSTSFSCTAPCSPDAGHVFIIIAYCTSGTAPTCFNSIDTSGRRYASVTLVSNTSLTLGTAWPLATCTGCKFSTWPIDGSVLPQSWFGESTNNNYYDDAKMFYQTYYRTGIEDFLAGARWFADAWYNSPYIDKFSYAVTHSTRQYELEGIVMRMLDEESYGTSPKRANLEAWCDSRVETRILAATLLPIGGYDDLREESYDMWQLGLCALYHSNSTKRATYVTDGDAALKGRWTTYRNSNGSWQGLYCTQICSTDIVVGSITATNGSNAVTLAGATWSTGQFCNAGTKAYIYLGTLADPTNGTPNLRYPITYDTRGYIATRTGTTTATLDANYTGTTGSLKAVFLSCNPLGGYENWAGPTTQPFFLGITSNAFRIWSYVLRNAASPDVAEAVVLDGTWQPGIANWLGTTAYNSDTAGDGKVYGGPYYGVGGGACGAPYGPFGNAFECYGAADALQSRELSPEMLNVLTTAYCLAPTSNLLSYGNTYYGKMFAKFMGETSYDGDNVAGDMEITSGFRYPRYEGKWPAFFWGVGRSQSWAAAIAGCTPNVPRSSRGGRFLSGGTARQ